MRAIKDLVANAALAAVLLLVACGGGNSGDGVDSAADRAAAAAVVKPKIVDPPDSIVVDVGSAARFSVKATGTATLRYQWYLDDKALRGANDASYTIARTAASANGDRYSVRVSNRAGTTSSASAKLTVRVWKGVRQDSPFDFATDRSYAIATDRLGAVLIAGQAQWEIPSNGSGSGAFVAKYGAGGTLRWKRQSLATGSVRSDVARGVATDSAGNVFVAGETNGTLPGGIAAGAADVTISKYKSDGKLVWARQFGSSRDDAARAIAVDSSGNIFVVGHGDAQLPLQPPTSGRDYFIAKYDTNGNRLWMHQSDMGLSFDEARGVAVDAAGNAYVAGRFASNDGGERTFIEKYNPAGASLWRSVIDMAVTPYAYANAIAVSSNGKTIYVVGRTFHNFDDPATPVTNNFFVSGDAFVARFDGAGKRQWIHNLSSQVLNGPRYFDDDAFAVATNASGSVVFVAGYTQGVMPGQASFGDADLYVARYQADGSRSWIRQIGSGIPANHAMNDLAYGIVFDPTGDLFVTGETLGTFGTPGRNFDLPDWFVLKMKPADGSIY